MKTVMSGAWLLAVAGAVIAGPVLPDSYEDVYVFPEGGVLTTRALIEVPGGFESVAARCFAGEFGEVGIPNFADDPGFFSDSLPAGLELSFNILDAARLWDGSDFDAISPSTLTLTQAAGVPGAASVTTPGSAGGFVGGFAFVTADGGGVIDEHVDILLDAPAGVGVYLLNLQLVDTSGALGSSAPFWFVMNNGASKAEVEAAKAYVESVIVPSPGTGLLAMAGLLGLRRRRR